MTDKLDFAGALEWFTEYNLPACGNTPPDIGHAKTIQTALRIADRLQRGEVSDEMRHIGNKHDYKSTRGILKPYVQEKNEMAAKLIEEESDDQ